LIWVRAMPRPSSPEGRYFSTRTKSRRSKFGRQDQEKISGAIAESRGQGARVGERHGRELEQIDLEKAFIIGDQLDLANSANEALGSYAEIAGRLNGATVGVVARPTEKPGDSVGVAENLNVLRLQVEVVLMLDGPCLPLQTPRRIIGEGGSKSQKRRARCSRTP
jgi:hypothetical protein